VILFIVYAICFASPNFAQYQFSPLATQIMEKYSLSPGQFNSIFTAPMIPAIFTSIISGLLVDRYGYKPVIGFSIIMTVVGCWLRVWAPQYFVMYIGMVLVGFSGGFMSSNSSKVLALLFGPEKVGVIAGIVLTASTCTLVLSMSTTALLPSMTFAFILAGVVAIVAMILWFLIMPNIKPKDIKIEAGAEEAPGLGESLKVVVKTAPVWLTGVMMFCVCGSMAGTGSMVPAALTEVRGISVERAGTIGSMLMVGNLLGSLITPTICNKTGKFRGILAICGIVCAVCCIFAWRLPDGVLLYAGMIVLGYCLGSGMASGLAMAVRIKGIGAKYAGTAGGLVATLQLLGGVGLPTYIASGIAGTNYTLYFIIIGIACVVWALSVVLMPKYLDTKI